MIMFKINRSRAEIAWDQCEDDLFTIEQAYCSIAEKDDLIDRILASVEAGKRNRDLEHELFLLLPVKHREKAVIRDKYLSDYLNEAFEHYIKGLVHRFYCCWRLYRLRQSRD